MTISDVAIAKGETLLFADVRQRFARNAIRELVAKARASL
jgi:hypothetical protein